MVDEDLDWYGPDAATFGDRVAAAREAAGMSQGQLARRLGVRKSTLAAWEADRSEPRANRLTMMAGILNVSVPWLLTGEGEGMTGPVEAGAGDAECREVLAELRALRAEMRASAERAARLEKRLRRMLGERAE